jgi:hypothetical protein
MQATFLEVASEIGNTYLWTFYFNFIEWSSVNS